MTSTPYLYVIGGCNGAGKTTASYTVLPEILHCQEFVNADEIARGLSPFQPEKMAIDAARIMLKRMDDLLDEHESFAFETTLASKTHRNKIIEAQQLGYKTTLLFFWLKSAELAKQRVKKRVAEGGHNIETAVIERRYKKGIENLFDIYLPIIDICFIFDNTHGKQMRIAEKKNDTFVVLNEEKFHELKQQYEFLKNQENRRKKA